MQFKYMAAFAASLLFIGFVTPAEARRVAHHTQQLHQYCDKIDCSGAGAPRYSVQKTVTRTVKVAAKKTTKAVKQTAAAVHDTGNAVIAEARRYIGTNPTGRRSLWCGAFASMVLQRTGHKPGGNLARAYANYGRRVAAPQVGALAVMSRGKHGGHVGFVSAVNGDGTVTVISGNHNNTTAETRYPAHGRIYAYVIP